MDDSTIKLVTEIVLARLECVGNSYSHDSSGDTLLFRQRLQVRAEPGGNGLSDMHRLWVGVPGEVFLRGL